MKLGRGLWTLLFAGFQCSGLKWLNLSNTERKRLHSIAHTCEPGAWWFWPRRRH